MSVFNNNNSQNPPLFGSSAQAKPAGTSVFGSSSPFGTPANAPAAPASGGLFGGNPTPSTTTPSGGLFGASASAPKPTTSFFANPAPSSNPSAPQPPSLFGAPAQPAASGSLLGAAKPAEQPKPPLFGQPSTTAAPAAASAFTLPTKPAETTTSLFGKPADAPASSSPFTLGTSPAPASGGLFGKPAAATTTPAPAAGSLFGKPATATPAATTSTTPAAPAFSLGGAKDGAATTSLFGSTLSKPEEKKDAPASTTAPTLLPTFSLGGDKTAPTSTAPAVAVAPPSMLRGKTIEEIVNKWSTELETHVREFNKFAGEVAVWDKTLLENANNFGALYSHVLAAEREQNDIDQSLEHIEQQQRDLSATLDAYEKATQEVFGANGGNLRAMDTGPADTERDKNYMLATELHTQLDDISGSLTQMIDSVNGLSLSPNLEASNENPMTQIAQILGSHLESLQWIDGAVREVEGKVSEVEKKIKDSGYGPSTNNSNGIKRSGYGL
ncbi:nuclear pore glycoprotein p62 [Mycena amicta]|nr:nuclear pore glycoprotein p62 [Mycena amicta]